MLVCSFVMAPIRLQKRFDKGVFLSRLNRFTVEVEVHGKIAIVSIFKSEGNH
jgi:DNA-binding sugar fermentation-stimulating protein